jgi:hypothetical protein
MVLEAKLNDLPTKFARRAMREAIGPAIDLWKDEIQARAEQFHEYATGWMTVSCVYQDHHKGQR